MENTKDFNSMLDKLIFNTQHKTIISCTEQIEKLEKDLEFIKKLNVNLEQQNRSLTSEKQHLTIENGKIIHELKSFKSLNTSISSHFEQQNTTIKRLKTEITNFKKVKLFRKITKETLEKTQEQNIEFKEFNKTLKVENNALKRKLKKFEQRKTKPKRVYTPIKQSEEDKEWLDKLLEEYNNSEEFKLDDLIIFDDIDDLDLLNYEF